MSQTSAGAKFRKALTEESPLQVIGTINANHALLAKRAGFKAIYLSGGGVGGFCVPNAQHAVRQAKLLAKNIVASLRGEGIKEYYHVNLGAVAGLGVGVGVFQFRKLAIKGVIAWFMHRGYHGLAMPMWERKIRVFSGWIWNFLLRRDIVAISATKDPRLAFETFASRPKA